KYVIYSHSHFDHIAGGQPFKDLGAMFVAHENAKARIETLKPADVVVLDQVVDAKRTINLSAARRSNCSTVKKATDEGKCYADAERDLKLPKYENWGNYGPFLPMNIERYCDFHNRGI